MAYGPPSLASIYIYIMYILYTPYTRLDYALRSACSVDTGAIACCTTCPLSSTWRPDESRRSGAGMNAGVLSTYIQRRLVLRSNVHDTQELTTAFLAADRSDDTFAMRSWVAC